MTIVYSNQNDSLPWFVQVQGQVYGPYTPEQMAAFVQEGRVVETSLVTQNPSTGFISAGDTDLFGFSEPISFGRRGAVGPVTAPTVAPVVAQVQPPVEITSPQPAVYLIMAEIGSDQAMRFLHLIQKLGTAQRIGDSVWLLKSEISIESLKLQLSSTLSRQDRLFILDSHNNKTAWHNIGADMGERIDELWGNQ